MRAAYTERRVMSKTTKMRAEPPAVTVPDFTTMDETLERLKRAELKLAELTRRAIERLDNLSAANACRPGR